MRIIGGKKPQAYGLLRKITGIEKQGGGGSAGGARRRVKFKEKELGM